MPRLIVNADDFGLTAGVNRAILELHRAGVVTSATLMASVSATAEAIEIARATPTLGVGCHIVFTRDEPVLPPGEIPSLVNPASGRFHPTLNALLRRLYTGRIHPAQIEAEARAQIRRLQDAGLRLTHIDTHKHTHMFPRMLRPLLRAARSSGITRIRNPFEPIWAVRATASAGLVRSAQVVGLRSLRPLWNRILAEEGFTTTDGTLAVAGTGALDAVALRSLVGQTPEGDWELVTHPGYNDADLARIQTRLRASRDIERRSLPALREISALELINFSAL